LLNLPRPLGVGVGQGGFSGSVAKTQMGQLSKGRTEAATDFPQVKEWAAPIWQNSMETNWSQQLNPLECFSASFSRTIRSKAVRSTIFSTWAKRLVGGTIKKRLRMFEVATAANRRFGLIDRPNSTSIGGVFS